MPAVTIVGLLGLLTGLQQWLATATTKQLTSSFFMSS
jgi:xanthosine utilization system XapX-like protein